MKKYTFLINIKNDNEIIYICLSILYMTISILIISNECKHSHSHVYDMCYNIKCVLC